MSEDMVSKDESYQITGACFEVHNHMGPGFLEAVCQECLELEFNDQNIPFVAQPNLKLKYKKYALKKRYVPVFLCYDKIVV